jgi:hypothetical protein
MLLDGLSIVVLGRKPARVPTLRAAKRAVAGLALMIAATSETVAHAESGTVGAPTDEQRSGARAAATAGGQAFRDGRWSDSVDLFTRAESVIHSPVHVLFLARAYEKLGKLVKAREAYLRLVNEQVPPSAPDPWRDAKAEAVKEAEALEPRLPYVTVKVQGAGAAPVTVAMDGVRVLAAFLGVPQPVDPGQHRLEAAAAGMALATGTIDVREGQRETIVLALHAATPGAQVPGANPRAAPHAAARRRSRSGS